MSIVGEKRTNKQNRDNIPFIIIIKLSHKYKLKYPFDCKLRLMCFKMTSVNTIMHLHLIFQIKNRIEMPNNETFEIQEQNTKYFTVVKIVSFTKSHYNTHWSLDFFFFFKIDLMYSSKYEIQQDRSYSSAMISLCDQNSISK